MITKRDLECEIKELELEIKDHETAIQNLNNIKERKQQQLNKFPITLERIITDCMINHNSCVQLELIENILDRVEVELLPKKIKSYGDYDEGWNDYFEELERRLRE
jgi:hypothetical protein